MKNIKKQITYFIISFAVVLIGAAFYMGLLQKRAKESLLERIPASKPHSHVFPAGDVVEHTHTPIRPAEVQPESSDPDLTAAKHPILRVWENLDLAAIKRDYQPYTVQEIIEKWHEGYMNFERPYLNKKSRARFERLEAYWPREEWLQHLMDNGFPFSLPVHYTFAFNARDQALMAKDKFDNPETRAKFLEDYRLPVDATWEEMEDVSIKFDIVARLNGQRAKDVDPSVYGGVTNLNGVFTPFTPNTVYVHVSKDTPLSTFTGAMLTEEQKNDLTMFGVAPKGVTVVYTDENGNPLPSDVTPRFYERQMAALEVAEAHVEQLIADHEALFKTLPAQPQKTAPEEQPDPSQQPQQAQPHLRDGSALRENERRPDIPIDRRNIPPDMLPPDPPSRANIQQWFEVLQELHGGELPKDLRVLQAAINELEEIRQAAAEKQQATRQRPSERSAPKPPDAPE